MMIELNFIRARMSRKHSNGNFDKIYTFKDYMIDMKFSTELIGDNGEKMHQQLNRCVKENYTKSLNIFIKFNLNLLNCFFFR